ncbi:MAG: nucleoside hydrolase [Treponema sp.]|jgi:pyrimidine-specific ribonucleoside hydrolase|nr:nucleoside hydrolase [Treponema sp.]
MRKVILDCDPGHDDAFAIMLAVRHLEVLGITGIGGNCVIENVTRNALKILELIGRPGIPVYRGHSRPLVTELVTAPQFHGKSGLDGPELPEPAAKVRDGHGVDFIIDTLKSVDGVTLIATGPLTNIAAALNRAPEIAARITEISIMGGSASFGNWTPAAEFNIFVDPEAAYRVFNAGLHIKMCGLNLTRQCRITREEADRIRSIPTKTAAAAAELLGFYLRSSEKVQGVPGADLHDPCAAAWIIDPSLVKGIPMHVTVELKGEFTRGMTVCDYRHTRGSDPLRDICHEPSAAPLGEKPNAEVGVELDREGFFRLLFDTLAGYP